MIRGCCCQPAPDIDCPSCPSGCDVYPDPGPGPCRWRLEVAAENVTTDSAGHGIVAAFQGDGMTVECTRGSCERVPYRRKAVYSSLCDEEYVCGAIMDDDAPELSGSHVAIWSKCYGWDQESPPDIENEQWGAVEIEYVQVVSGTSTVFGGVACGVGWTSNTCWTLVGVRFTYSDSFAFDLSSECEIYSSDTFNVTREWFCVYGKKNAPGKRYAEGAYKMLRCIYPSAVTTLSPSTNPTGRCNIAGGELCSDSEFSGVTNIPTLWKPPSTIVISRLA